MVLVSGRFRAFYVGFRLHLSQQSQHTLQFPRGQRDPGPRQRHVPGRPPGAEVRPHPATRGLDGAAQLRLRGLRARPLHRRQEPRRPPPGRDPECHRREQLLHPGAAEALQQHPLCQWGVVQRGLEPLHLRLHWHRIPGLQL